MMAPLPPLPPWASAEDVAAHNAAREWRLRDLKFAIACVLATALCVALVALGGLLWVVFSEWGLTGVWVLVIGCCLFTLLVKFIESKL